MKFMTIPTTLKNSSKTIILTFANNFSRILKYGEIGSDWPALKMRAPLSKHQF